MAMMLPSVISPDVKSSAERRIFEWFRDAPQTEDWIVLHSLGITAHKKVIYGETDFFVLAPQLGIFALEVKGGRVRRENGIWYFTDKYEHADSRSRGPFDQAKEGIFSIISALKVRLDKKHEYLKNVFYGYGVMFPDIEYQAKGIDEEQWQVFDARDGQNVRKFMEHLSQKSQKHWADTYGNFDSSKLPGREDIKYLASILRGDFDYTISFSSQIRAVKEEQVRLTREQYRCLDQLDDNPRCLIQGPAGTGKTLIALEQVKKAAANGKKVALFCYNSNLASWMEAYFSKVSDALQPAYVGTLHAYMRSVLKKHEIQVKYPADPQRQAIYYEKNLPEIVIRQLQKTGAEFDEIIVDEAQDLLHDSYLDVMDICLKKGLSRGHWTMFGDFSMQAIYTNGVSGSDLIERLEERTSFIRFRLTINCRNTKPICEEIETVTGFDPAKKLMMKTEGPPVQYLTWSTMEEQRNKLEKVLDELDGTGVYPESITILSPKKREDSVVSMLEGRKIKNFVVPMGMNVSYSTIHSFKGLENTIIIMTDIDSFASDKLMYVGLSRACSGLFILMSDGAKREYDNLLIRRLLK